MKSTKPLLLPRWLTSDATFLGVLFLLEYLVFSGAFAWFFQGDALFWMAHRYDSWSEFFRALYTLDVANWYRPLSNRTIPSIFFPLFGLNPYGYHWVVFILFFLSTALVYRLLKLLAPRRTAAIAGTLFFALHSINVHTTYDFAYAPEVLYTGFYVASCIAFLRRPFTTAAYAASVGLFVLALMSKEAAITLPPVLVLLTLGLRDTRPVRQTLPFFVVAIAYYLYIVRFLHVGAGDYAVALHEDLLWRPVQAALWAFHFLGLQRGAWNHLAYYLLTLAAAAILVAAVRLPPDRRRLALIGLGWFLVAMIPTVGIVGYFGPYYLFLPLVGMALAVGVCIASIPWRVPQGLIIATFVMAAAGYARTVIGTSPALGLSGRIARQSLQDVKTAYPTLPQGAVFYIVNPAEPELWRYYGLGSLMQLGYDDPSIEVFYSSLGHTAPPTLMAGGKLVAFQYRDGGLENITTAFREDPSAFIRFLTESDFQYVTSDRLRFEVEPTRVVAGRDSYTIRVRGAESSDAELQYRYNEGPVAHIRVHLDANGETSFFVSRETKHGRYRFVGIRPRTDGPWVRTEATVEVVGP